MGSAAKSFRIVAADDSAVIRHMLTMLFDSVAEFSDGLGPRMELCATPVDGVECLAAVRALRPDAVLLDLEMPRMSGMEVLDLLQRERPEMPVLMCSAYTVRGAVETLEALARGAVDYVTKPSGSKDPMSAMASLSAQLLPKLAALAERSRRVVRPSAVVNPVRQARRASDAAEVVAIGVSTGGPAALEQLLPALPRMFGAPIVIAQHMPKLFTNVLAERLNRLCALNVQQAYQGAALNAGEVWIAPGDSHMEVGREPNGTLRVVLHDRPPLHHCRPAVDYLFRSMARVCGERSLGLVLTGMGSDGLAGSRDVVKAGGEVLAQDEASSAVWGMPGRVVEEGLASAVLPLGALADELKTRVSWSMPGVASRPKEKPAYAV